VANILFAILLAYTLGWAAVNIYNLYPLLNYYTRRKETEAGDDYRLPAKLPKISILLPAYHEELVLMHSIENIFKSDYPPERLDVIILTEEDDSETIRIAKDLAKKYGARHVQVEATDEPKGKPRALNFGLKHITGDIVGVIDAEDIIDPKLFKKVTALLNSGYDAVQGVLDMVNDRDGFTNMHLRAEYRYWYRT
jgi:cellulose synthase/poly-beta-1,6-N-acetylglucosamine synthase-like glycosyltransferase